MEAQTYLVPGPMHPDLFDGETPIMVPTKLKAFRVQVTWVERHREAVYVLAENADQAGDKAVGIVERQECDGDEFDCDEAQAVDARKLEPWQREQLERSVEVPKR